MALFAEIVDNTVARVIVVADTDCRDKDGNHSEAAGAAFCADLLGGTWVETAADGSIRGKYAGPGDTYDPDADLFIAPPPPPVEEPAS